jgi:hypothetical protein
MTRAAGPTTIWLFQALLLDAMTTYIERSDLDAALSIKLTEVILDVSYAAPQAHGIVNVALHREYSLGIAFIFSQGRKDLYHV